MLVKVFSLAFDSALGNFNDAELREFLKDKEIISIQEHFLLKPATLETRQQPCEART